jgi:hypothetical protein
MHLETGTAQRSSAVLLAVTMFAATLLLGACSREPAEVRLRATIDAMQAAAIERRPGDFMEQVADDFVGRDGMDRAALHNLLRVQLLRNAKIGASFGPLEIEMQEPRATVRFTLVLTGGSGGLLPERAQGYAITSGWREVDGEWQLFLAEWKPKL